MLLDMSHDGHSTTNEMMGTMDLIEKLFSLGHDSTEGDRGTSQEQ